MRYLGEGCYTQYASALMEPLLIFGSASTDWNKRGTHGGRRKQPA